MICIKSTSRILFLTFLFGGIIALPASAQNILGSFYMSIDTDQSSPLNVEYDSDRGLTFIPFYSGDMAFFWLESSELDEFRKLLQEALTLFEIIEPSPIGITSIGKVNCMYTYRWEGSNSARTDIKLQFIHPDAEGVFDRLMIHKHYTDFARKDLAYIKDDGVKLLLDKSGVVDLLNIISK